MQNNGKGKGGWGSALSLWRVYMHLKESRSNLFHKLGTKLKFRCRACEIPGCFSSFPYCSALHPHRGPPFFFFFYFLRQTGTCATLPIRTKLKNKIDRKISEFLSKRVYEWLSEVIWLPVLFPQRWHGYVCMCFNIYIRDVSYIYILIFLHLKWIWVSRVTHMSRHVDRWCEYVSWTRPKRVLKSWM